MKSIREIREARGMSQDELAAKSSEMDLDDVKCCESGLYNPRSSELASIAEVLDVPVTYFHLLDDPSDDPLIQQFKEVARKTLGIKSDE